jgi:hypothetical protein
MMIDCHTAVRLVHSAVEVGRDTRGRIRRPFNFYVFHLSAHSFCP